VLPRSNRRGRFVQGKLPLARSFLHLKLKGRLSYQTGMGRRSKAGGHETVLGKTMRRLHAGVSAHDLGKRSAVHWLGESRNSKKPTSGWAALVRCETADRSEMSTPGGTSQDSPPSRRGDGIVAGAAREASVWKLDHRPRKLRTLILGTRRSAMGCAGEKESRSLPDTGDEHRGGRDPSHPIRALSQNLP